MHQAICSVLIICAIMHHRVFALQDDDCASDRMLEKKEDLEERLMPELKSLALGTTKE